MKDDQTPLLYSDDIEAVPVDEGEDIARIVEAMQKLLARQQAKSGEFVADVHVKSHGYAKGEFRVLPNLPDELAQGIFEQVHDYPAVVRFSNAASERQSDALPDGRGMAIKVLDITGATVSTDEHSEPTQDFLMINHPVFFARNAKEFQRLEQVLVEAKDSPLAVAQGALTGGDWNPLNWHWREMLSVAQTIVKLPEHPASNTYFSASPIRFGKHVAKYRAKPAGDRQDSYLDLITRLGSDTDAMRLALEETLRTQELLFEFQVQLRTSGESMPVEDPTVEWSERESPYRTVAHLLLPRQDIAPFRQQTEFQNLAFSVWHALAAHRPLGGINRVRRAAYPVSSAWRRQKTHVKSEVPPSV